MYNHCIRSIIFSLIFLPGNSIAQQYKKVPVKVPSAGVQEKINQVKTIKADQFEPGSFHGDNTITIPYRLLRPLFTGQQRYPLVIVFHGSGAVGNDNVSQVGFLAKSWAEPGLRQRFPAFVLVPQFPSRSSNYEMDPVKKVLSSKVQPPVKTVLALIDSLVKVLPVDKDRVYVEGFSMGGSTTMNVLTLRPDLFAAGIAFSGIADLNATGKLTDIPLWIIHGNADTENPFASDSLFYKEMQAKNAKRLRFWEIDQLEHQLPFDLVEDGTIATWLFRQRKRR